VDVALDARPGSIARKLYPCCYATHRLIAAALAARGRLGAAPPADAVVTLHVPAGGMQPLRSEVPRTGLEAKFSAEYTVAVALWQGSLELADFEDAAVARPEAAARMSRVRVIEEPVPAEGSQGLEHGVARLAVSVAGQLVATGEAGPIPGSPARPATRQEMAAKIADCLDRHAAAGGKAVAPAAFMATLDRMLAPAAAQAA
jgi:2-methylcitrate dehydratase PrpD